VPKGDWPASVVEKIKVHGAALEGNLEGDSVDRDVLVVLPASYAKSPHRRYPVIYFLHGFALTGQVFSDYVHVAEAAAHWASKGDEFIVVVPDTDTKQGGSMYSNSPTTGDFEAFIAKDLVGYIDGHYRTLAKRASRGLAGHSMGGYGVWKIGMKYPQVWSSLYAMSACCVSPRTETVEAAQKIAAVPFDQSAKADFGTRAALASAVAWSPDPAKPPYFADFAYKDGAIDPEVIAEWAANSPLAMVPQYVPALKSMTAIGAEVGNEDGLIKDDTAIHDELTRFGIAHDWAVYPGNHANHIGARFDQVVLPFFAQHLAMK
jgi:enterochelin esterase-like enzyme